MDAVLAVDVGGTNLKCGVVGLDGRTLSLRRFPTGRERGPQVVVSTVLDVLEQMAEQDGVTPRAVGVVVPGLVDERRGVARFSANLGWRDVPLLEMVRQRLGLPSVLGHDVRAGGLAEARAGGHEHALFVPVGTGIAAAYVVGGKALTGAHDAAGELGHVVVRPGGPRCGCGGSGCLEAVASAAAIGREYSARTGALTSAATVAARAAAGEAVAAAVWAEAVDALADGLATAVALLDPAVVIVGGGLAEAGETLFVPLRRALGARPTFLEEPRVVPAALGDDAGCLGAAQLALDALVDNSRVTI